MGKPIFAAELDERGLDVRVERLHGGPGRPGRGSGAEPGWWYVRVRRPAPGAPSTVARSKVLAEAMRWAIDGHDAAERVAGKFADPAPPSGKPGSEQ